MLDAARKWLESGRVADVRFHVREEIPKGSLSDGTGPLSKPGVLVPPNDTIDESDNRVVFQGKMARYECNHPMWSGEGRGRTSKSNINTTNGVLGKSLYPEGISTDGRGVGIIPKKADCENITIYYLLPLTTYYSGLVPGLTGEPLQLLKWTGQTRVIAGERCDEYRRTHNMPGLVRAKSFWFTQDIRPVALQVQMLDDGKLRQQWDIQYKHDPQWGRIPDKWEWHSYAPAGGPVLRRTEVRITQTSETASVDPTTFDIEFPPGSYLADLRENKHYRILDGREKIEVAADWSELPNAVVSNDRPWGYRNSSTLVGVGVLLVIVGCGLLVRRRIVRNRAL